MHVFFSIATLVVFGLLGLFIFSVGFHFGWNKRDGGKAAGARR